MVSKEKEQLQTELDTTKRMSRAKDQQISVLQDEMQPHLATAALHVQSVEDRGIQADYLAIAPGKQLVGLNITMNCACMCLLFQAPCVGWMCVGRQYWRWWGTGHRSWSGLAMASTWRFLMEPFLLA